MTGDNGVKIMFNREVDFAEMERGLRGRGKVEGRAGRGSKKAKVQYVWYIQ